MVELSSAGMSIKDWAEVQWFMQNEQDIRDKWWHVKEGDVVLDVGSAVGSWSLPALGAGACVIAIEPDSDFYFRMTTQLTLNGFSCYHYNCLLGSENSIRHDFFPKSHSMRPEGQAESRNQITVDTLVKRLKLTRLNWVKIDTEGAEFEVLRGGTKTWIDLHPKIIIEYHEQFVKGVSEKCRRALQGLSYVEEVHSEAYSKWHFQPMANEPRPKPHNFPKRRPCGCD